MYLLSDRKVFWTAFNIKFEYEVFRQNIPSLPFRWINKWNDN